MPTLVKTGVIASLLFLISACTLAPQTSQIIKHDHTLAVSKYEINNVPFIAQQEYFCGPTTLTEIVQFYGNEQTPEGIAPSLFIPQKLGSLQVEMVAATRQNNLLAYADSGNLTQLFNLVLDDIPVIVLQNNGLSWYPMWHYAVVIGFDLSTQQVTLHSGVTKQYQMDMALFEKTWQRGKFWYLAAVPDNKITEHFEPLKYVSAAQDLLSVNKTDIGIKALQTATLMWREYWLSYFLLGNHYLTKDVSQAIYWYQQGFEFGKGQAAYLNNYAFALAEQTCINAAKHLITQAKKLAPDNPNILESYHDLLSSKITDSCQINEPVF